MTAEEIAIMLAKQEQHIKSQAHRLDKLEQQQEAQNQIVRSVDKLAQSIEVMAKEQKRQGEKIDLLEKDRSETFKYWLRTILTAVATGVVGYMLALLFAK